MQLELHEEQEDTLKLHLSKLQVCKEKKVV